MPHPLPRPARAALTTIKLALVGCIVVAGWATQSDGAASGAGYAVGPAVSTPGDAGSATGQRSARLRHLLDRHGCSVTGFETGIQPPSAVVRRADGRLRFVSFDIGWRVYRSHGAAQLVAVCRDEAPAQN